MKEDKTFRYCMIAVGVITFLYWATLFFHKSTEKEEKPAFLAPLGATLLDHCEKVAAGELFGPFKAQSDAAWVRAGGDCHKYFDILFNPPNE